MPLRSSQRLEQSPQNQPKGIYKKYLSPRGQKAFGRRVKHPRGQQYLKRRLGANDYHAAKAAQKTFFDQLKSVQTHHSNKLSALESQPDCSPLYHATHGGTPAQIYLYGISHGCDFKKLPVRESVQSAALKCDTMAMEQNPDTYQDKACFKRLLERTGNDFRNLMTTEQVCLFQAFCRLIKINPDKVAFYQFKAISVAIRNRWLKSLGIKTTNTEKFFIDHYKKADAEVLCLEEASSHTQRSEAIMDIDQETQIASINNTLSNLRSLLDNAIGSLEIFRLPLRDDCLEGAGVTFKSIHSASNQRMLETIRTHIKDNPDKNIFAIPGALHLVGDIGLIKLLENDGWNISQSPSPQESETQL